MSRAMTNLITAADLANRIRAARSTVLLPARVLQQLVHQPDTTQPPHMLPAEPVYLLLTQLEDLLDQAEAAALALEHEHLEQGPAA